MTQTPWLSVLIPVYNVLPYLRECLDSVREQADDGVEILLVDDCSTDGSAALMQELAAQDDRIRCLAHECNSGLSAARNTLLEAARGEYVWFLDSDDFLAPGAIAGLKRIVQAQAPDLVMCDFRMLRERTRLKHRWRGELHRKTFPGRARTLLTDSSALIEGLFQAGQLHSWSKITRRSLWADGLRFPVGRYFEDMGTTPFLALRAKSFWYEPEVWVVYRQRPGSILSTPNLTKAEHMAGALMGLPEAATGHGLNSAAQFAWTHYAARSFIAAARIASRASPEESQAQLATYQRLLQQSAPISLSELQAQYRRRGWFLRSLRLRYWMKRCKSTAALVA
jgi:hypothetical protein